MHRFATLLTLVLLASGVSTAQTPGTCSLGTAEGDLNVSNVFARLFNTGSLFFGGTTTSGDGYLVPQRAAASPLFAAGLWLGGTIDGEPSFAGSRYNNFNFWPGPLEDDGTLPDPSDCSGFDRIYVVDIGDLLRYENTGEASTDLQEWPVGLGAPAVTASGAPVAVSSREQTLDLSAGQRPVIYGSQTAFWVMNDLGGSVPRSVTGPLGVEVRVIAYSTVSREVAGAQESTFYRYEIVNRSPRTINDLRIGFFVDPEIGNGADDYIGTDTTRAMVYAYNAEETDAVYGTPPALGFDLLSGAASTSNPDMSATSQYYVEDQRMLNYLRGLWFDGSPVRANGTGYEQPATFPITTQVFPGDPVAGDYWSEVNIDGSGTMSWQRDRTMLIVSPEADLASGESRTVDLGIHFAQGQDRFDSITQLRAVSDGVQSAYDDGSLFTLGGAESGLTALAAPQPLAPEAGRYIGQVDSVTFAWAPVAGAQAYELLLPSFFGGDGSRLIAADTTLSVPVSRLTQGSGEQPVEWRVRAIAENSISTVSETQTFRVFQAGVLRLSRGDLAYIETQNAQGAVCPRSGSESCAEAFGDLVYRSLNSTREFYIGEAMGPPTPGSDETLRAIAPHDVEMRFTEEGSLAAYADQTPYNVVRVPFEIWDIGDVGLGNENDPSDDVRLVPILFADGGGTCAFNPDEIPEGEAWANLYVESDRVHAYRPATSYGDFEEAFRARVASASDGCVASGDGDLLAYTAGDRVLQNMVFGSAASSPVLPARGTVVRIYTTSVAPPPEAPMPPEPKPPALPEAFSLILGPNPTRGSATLRLRLPEDASVDVRVFDTLGRRVSFFSETDVQAGEPSWTLLDGLASGVYAVEVRVGTTQVTRLVTITR